MGSLFRALRRLSNNVGLAWWVRIETRDPNVVYWEVMEDGVHVYTKEDSLRDERERWRYIDSLYKAEEHLYNYSGDTTYIQ